MLVSIITATYNSANFINETYDAIKNQSHENWEWLVTDDCSSDNTREILKEIASLDSRVILFFNNVNSGAAVTRNRSLSNVKGEFIAFIDSDDLWAKDKLMNQLEFMTDGINFSFTAYELVDINGNALNKTVGLNYPKCFSYIDQLYRKGVIGCSTVMLRKSAFDDLKMPLIRSRQDYAFWLKLLKHGEKAYSINKVLTRYRIVPNSISSNKFKAAMQTWYVYRNIEKLSFFASLRCFLSYAWTGVFK
ncbi:glycosyltransferase [Vibrio sp. B1Z05]|uniref:glycosyltransferase family 2 protein n=1 Tax=Vibrio sp. B1Z05 TaxID=2654980 RepID=UPI00128D58C9|nr:glycosyltransferase [Vibrio sp. B1Z05]MPW36269.1 glycosyltransferase [Vibrio sp. B1Z05]